MASIFTYDPDPPRVASPWLTPTATPKPSTPQPRRTREGLNTLPSGHISDYGVTRLGAEPQEGPTEYKLHLLLRPRRTYSSSSTGIVISGSQQNDQHHVVQPLPNELGTGPIYKSSKSSRQTRLESLTTQLLWRLQQSSPNHASSTSELIVPQLPEHYLDTPSKPGKLLAGLEESRGALYEIGVSDDGTFVGLTKDEMDESLKNLKAMSASLGCNVEIVRMVVVGECEWFDPPSVEAAPVRDQSKPKLSAQLNERAGPRRHQEQLWVAEALVMPDLSSRKAIPLEFSNATIGIKNLSLATPSQGLSDEDQFPSPETTEQLRVTLTGPTTSGKSSLLGTLSTATLDNGRGKSRLSLLKHRHELVSGVTSSVAQELIGYKNNQVITFASGNVNSWTDIHQSAETGRLILFSDSAGHPRYRRTIVRGLVGWDPHYVVLCEAADSENAPSGAGGTSSAQEILGTAGAATDLAQANLELCLKLNRPLVIVITKLDLASKTSLRQCLSKILSAVKASGRTPSLLSPDPSKFVQSSELGAIPAIENENIRKITDRLKQTADLTSIVPIILTSAAKGNGIQQLHSLLQNLPVPAQPTSNDFIGHALNPEQPACLFHIEDVFGLPASYESLASNTGRSNDNGVVVAGYLRFGRFSVGDKIVTGPFPVGTDDEASPPPETSGYRSSPNSFGGPVSHPSTTERARAASRNLVSASLTKGEFFNARIVSIRNLRLPVHTLEAGQVGTIGIVIDIPDEELSNGPFERQPPKPPRPRKGMVIAIPSKHMIQTGLTLQAASGFTASFEDGDINSVTPGSLVVIYIASIRATAKVIRLAPQSTRNGDTIESALEDVEDDVFGLDGGKDENETGPAIFGSDGITGVQFELITNREWVELGSQVLVMPGGGGGLYAAPERGEKGVAGLEGFVGKVIEVVD